MRIKQLPAQHLNLKAKVMLLCYVEKKKKTVFYIICQDVIAIGIKFKIEKCAFHFLEFI